MDLHYCLYDTWEPGTTAHAEATLFQVAEGGDSTHTEQYTNMRGAGSLPNAERFLVKRVHLIQDENVTDADFDTYLYGAIVEMRVKDKTMFKVPAQLLFSHSAKAGHFAQATAADAEFIGPVGDGWALEIPIEIPPGAPFKVRCKQGGAFATTISFKLVLEGILSTPD